MPQHTDAHQVASPSFYEHLARARALKENGAYPQAVSLLEDLLVEDPGSATVLEEIAENEWCMGHIQRALFAARRAVTLCAESAMGNFILGLIALQKREWDSAVEYLRRANRSQPDTPDILRSLGWALFHHGETTQGIVTLERALNLEEGNTHTLCDLGEVYLALRYASKARALFLRALEIDPGDSRAQEGIAHVGQQERVPVSTVASPPRL